MDVIKTSLNTVSLVLMLLLPGIILLFLRRREIVAKYLILAGFILLCLLSFRPFSNFLLWDLEDQYPPLMELDGYKEVRNIILLAAWDSNVPTLPYTSNLGYRSAFRTLEAQRIYHGLDHARVIISGSKDSGKLIKMFLKQLGVLEKDIAIDESENTFQSAVNLKGLLEGNHFILVSSATHLPRAMDIFKRKGLQPIPAPADYLYGYYPKYQIPFPRSLSYYIPNTDSLMRSSAALYEYLGKVWYSIKAIGEEQG